MVDVSSDPISSLLIVAVVLIAVLLVVLVVFFVYYIIRNAKSKSQNEKGGQYQNVNAVKVESTNNNGIYANASSVLQQ